MMHLGFAPARETRQAASCSALVKGAAPSIAASGMSLASHAALAARGVAAFFEWIDSDANPADPSSRLGFGDPWVASQISSGSWRVLPLAPPPRFGLDASPLDLVFKFFSALGSGAM